MSEAMRKTSADPAASASGEGPEIDPQPPKRSNLGRQLVIATVLGVLVFAALSLYGDVRALAASLGR